MKYIAHKRYKGIALTRSADDKAIRVNLPYGTEVESAGEFIVLNGVTICRIASYVGHRFFSRNDDGQGLKRGALTEMIAYAERDGGNGYRFSDSEQHILRRDWSKFLKQFDDVILFNDNFFAADVDELQKLAEVLR